MYTHLFLLSQIAINTKDRINLQTETNKHSFFSIIHCLCHSSNMLMSAGWWPTRNVIWKSSSFSKRRWLAIWHLDSGRPANIASCYKGIMKFSWGDVMEWMSSQIKYVNLYCFFFNSPYLSCMELKWSQFALKKFQNLFHFIIWPGFTEPSLWTRCNPSLANDTHLVVARHPGTSFPVHHPQEAVPKSTNGSCSTSLPWSSPFWDPYKQGSSWWHYIFHVCQGIEHLNMQWCFTCFTKIYIYNI